MRGSGFMWTFMQNNQQLGSRAQVQTSRARAFGKVPEETTHTCPWATNKTIHSSSLPYAQNYISPDLSEAQLRWVGEMKLVTK